MIDRILLRFFSFLDSIIEPIDRIFEPKKKKKKK